MFKDYKKHSSFLDDIKQIKQIVDIHTQSKTIGKREILNSQDVTIAELNEHMRKVKKR